MTADLAIDRRPAEKGSSFHLKFRPCASLVNEVRRFAVGFYERMLHDDDYGSRIAIATHELLENTVKYSSDGVTDLSIVIEPAGEATRLTIRTRNRTVDEHRDVVRRFFDEMRLWPSPSDYFQELMRRTVLRERGSGLGLARVAAEAEMSLDYEITGEDLTVIARAILREGGGQA